MKSYMQKWKRLVVILLCSIMFGFGIMIAISGIHYAKAGNHKGKYAIKTSNVKMKSNAEGEKVIKTITIKMPRQYVDKFVFEYQSEDFSNFNIEVDKKNIYGVTENETIQDEFMEGLPRSVVNINGKISNIKITYIDQEKPVSINNFSIDNSFKMNPLIWIFCTSITFILMFLIVFRKENARNEGIAAFVCIFASSSCLLILSPFYINGWDEQIHYTTAYELGVTKEGEHATRAQDYMYVNAPKINNVTYNTNESIEERLDMMRLMGRRQFEQGAVTDNYTIQLSSVGYVLQALGLKIGNMLHLTDYICWILGKFMNVLLYAVVMGIAVHIVPVGKRLLMVISMLPIMIFQSTTYTYDVTVIAFLTLATCIFVREFFYKNQKFKYKWRVAFFASMFLGCLPKAVYAPLILCMLLLGEEKFYSKKDKWIFKLAIVIGGILLACSFMLPTLIKPAQGGDSRGGNTSTANQIEYVLGQPFAYTVVLLKNIIISLPDYIIGNSLLCNWAYLGKGTMTYCSSALLAGVTLSDSYVDSGIEKKVYSLKMRIAMMIQYGMAVVLVWTALYLSFTEVGKSVISGVQARYYLPFIFGVYLCFQTDKISNNIKKEVYQMIVMIISVTLLFIQILNLVLLPKCL